MSVLKRFALSYLAAFVVLAGAFYVIDRGEYADRLASWQHKDEQYQAARAKRSPLAKEVVAGAREIESLPADDQARVGAELLNAPPSPGSEPQPPRIEDSAAMAAGWGILAAVVLAFAWPRGRRHG